MDLTIYTIGHSNQAMQDLLNLLRTHRIEEVVDVRSRPASRYCPHFDKRNLQASLDQAGIAYTYLGQELGGMPRDRNLYDSKGKVLYDRLTESDSFQQGLTRLLALTEKHRSAILCAEENPVRCHRCLAIGVNLADRGATVLHIRKNGQVQSQQEVAREAGSDAGQIDLF